MKLTLADIIGMGASEEVAKKLLQRYAADLAEEAKKAGDPEQATKLQTALTDLETAKGEIKTLKNQAATDKKQAAIREKLLSDPATTPHDMAIVLGLIDPKSIKLDDSGNVDLGDVVDKLKTDKPFLFKSPDSTAKEDKPTPATTAKVQSGQKPGESNTETPADQKGQFGTEMAQQLAGTSTPFAINP